MNGSVSPSSSHMFHSSATPSLSYLFLSWNTSTILDVFKCFRKKNLLVYVWVTAVATLQTWGCRDSGMRLRKLSPKMDAYEPCVQSVVVSILPEPQQRNTPKTDRHRWKSCCSKWDLHNARPRREPKPVWTAYSWFNPPEMMLIKAVVERNMQRTLLTFHWFSCFGMWINPFWGVLEVYHMLSDIIAEQQHVHLPNDHQS